METKCLDDIISEIILYREYEMHMVSNWKMGWGVIYMLVKCRKKTGFNKYAQISVQMLNGLQIKTQR